jgi:hypothetical protein
MVVPIVRFAHSVQPALRASVQTVANAFNGLNRADAIKRIERFERVPPIGTWREKLKT